MPKKSPKKPTRSAVIDAAAAIDKRVFAVIRRRRWDGAARAVIVERLPDIKSTALSRSLQRLRERGMIEADGNTKAAVWFAC